MFNVASFLLTCKDLQFSSVIMSARAVVVSVFDIVGSPVLDHFLLIYVSFLMWVPNSAGIFHLGTD